MIRRLLAALLAASLASGILAQPALAAPKVAGPPPGTVALTFDDLPGMSLFFDAAWNAYLNRTLIAGLKRNHLPATGFVNEIKLVQVDRAQQTALLKAWLDAGLHLGNHTFGHVSPNAVGVEGYEADVLKGEATIRPLLEARHQPLAWFRHPYLETGSPLATRQAIDAFLAAHGYRTAPVTMEASDWRFSDHYDDALARHDQPGADAVRAEYLAYTRRMIDWYRSAARAVFGRDIAYVWLLHDTRLNADTIDALAALLKAQNLKAVSLDEAMKDPAYATPDSYAGPNGIEWLERWSDGLKKPLPWEKFAEPPADIVAEPPSLQPAPATAAPAPSPAPAAAAPAPPATPSTSR